MSLTLAQDRKLVRDTSPSTRYLLATIQAPEQDDAEPRAPLNVALVIDRSGSMAGAKIVQARQAASYALGLLDAVDRAAVVAYDDIITVLASSKPITPRSVADARAAITTLRERGVTNLSEGWLTGCREVAEHLAPGQIARCLLLTDGLANRGITDLFELEQHARQLRLRGVITSTFGIGEGFNEVLLSRMASAGGGNFRLIRDAEEIPRLVREELVESLEVVAPNTELLVRAPAGVKVTPLSDFEYRATAAGEMVVALGDLLSEQSLSVVLRLDFEPGATGAELPCELRLRDGADRLDTRTHTFAFTRATDSANDGQARDRAVDRKVGALHAARTRRAALAFNRDGDYVSARRAIDACIARLRRYAGEDPELLAVIADLESARGECVRPMEEMAFKDMYLDSISLSRSRTSYGSALRASSYAATWIIVLSTRHLDSTGRAAEALRAAGFTAAGMLRLVPSDHISGLIPLPAGEVLSTVDELQLVDRMRLFTKGGVRLGLVDAPLYDNWFSHWHAAGRAAVVSMHAVTDLIGVDPAAFIAYEIVLNGLANASPAYDFMALAHDDTRGCLFDLCLDKRDMEIKLQAMHVCAACQGKLAAMGVDLDQVALATDAIRGLAQPVAHAAPV